MTNASLVARVRAYRDAYFGPTEPAHRHERRPPFSPPPPAGLADLLDDIIQELER